MKEYIRVKYIELVDLGHPTKRHVEVNSVLEILSPRRGKVVDVYAVPYDKIYDPKKLERFMNFEKGKVKNINNCYAVEKINYKEG